MCAATQKRGKIRAQPNDEQVAGAVETMRMLADTTRLRVLWALLDGEHSVGRLAELVGANPAAASQHLAKLRLARVVTTRRDGNHIFYAVANSHVRRLLEEVLFHADHISQGLPDHP